MQKLVRSIRLHKGDLIVGFLKATTYVGLFLIFYLFMSIHNWPLLHPSRTLATTVLTWVAMTAAMHGVYGGYAIGRKKSKPIISNMSLGSFCVDLVTYLQLQIMNVNENNRSYLDLFGQDFKWLCLAYVIQCVFLVALVRLGNHWFFQIYAPKNCLLILGNMSDRAALVDKLNHYRLQWRVKNAVLWDDPAIEKKIEASEVVFIAGVPEGTSMHLLKICYDLRRDVLCKASLQDIMIASAEQVVVDDAPFLEMDYHKMTLWQRIVKRSMDIGISLCMLIVLMPIMLISALLIYLEDRGPVIFSQERMTVRGRKFVIRKFRTMKVEASRMDHQVSAEENDARITRVGRVLRRFRIDEFPQLYNILIGDMTLVGPRPEMLENVEKYKNQLPTFVYREKVKAGLTGYAQIEGKYNTTPEDKLMLDLMYIENFSIQNDIKLLFRTVLVMFRKDSTQGFAHEDVPETGRNRMGRKHKTKRKQ